MTYSIGALLAGFSIQYLFRRMHLTDSIIWMTLAVSAMFMVLFVTRSTAIFYLMGIIMGLCNSGIRIQRVTYLFTRIPNELYGRVNSVFNMGNIMFRVVFLSAFSLPFFQEGNNVIFALLTLSIFLMIAVLILVYYRGHIILDQKNGSK